MAGLNGAGSASLLAGWISMLLLGCGVTASPDTELLMQAPFARELNWTAAPGLCNSTSQTATITCDGDGNVLSMSVPSLSSCPTSSRPLCHTNHRDVTVSHFAPRDDPVTAGTVGLIFFKSFTGQSPCHTPRHHYQEINLSGNVPCTG